MSRKISLHTGCSVDEIHFLLGKKIGRRFANNETVIIVVSEIGNLPEQLLGWMASSQLPADVKVCHGVGGVMDSVARAHARSSGPERQVIHVIYWMAQNVVHYDEDQLSNGGLPIYIASQTIQKQMLDPQIDKVTFFLE